MLALSSRAEAGLHGDRLARHFGITATSTLSVQPSDMAPVAMTRLRGAVACEQCTEPLRAEPAYRELARQ